MTAVHPAAASSPTLRNPDARYPCIEGCRAVAALGVVLQHTAGRAQWTTEGAAAPFLAITGGLGVAVFFALSGFLLYRPFAGAHLTSGRPPNIASYATRRLLRIFPAYWVALIAFVYVFDVANASTKEMNPLQLFGLAQIYSSGHGLAGIPAAWTLCVELSFYAFLPLYAIAVRSLAGRSASASSRLAIELGGVALLYATGVLFRWFVLSSQPTSLPLIEWLPSLLDWFAVGMAIAVASAWHAAGGRVPSVMRWLARVPGLSWLLALELLWLTTRLDLPSGFSESLSPGDHMIRNLYFGLIGFCMVVPLVFGDQQRGPLRALLRSRPARWIGTISYSVYLWHFLVLRELAPRLESPGSPANFWVLLGGTVAVTLVVATVSYLYVERPAMALKDWHPLRAVSRVERAASAVRP